MAFGKHSGLSHIYSHDPASFRLASLLFLASSLKLEFLGEGSVLTSGAPRSHLALPAALWLRPSPSPFLIIPELPADSMLLFLVQVFHTHLLLSPRRVGRRRSFSWEPLSLGFFATVILVFFLSSPGPFSSLQPLHVGVVESLALCASPPACSFSWAISPTSVAL